jgi:hypothetical protein
MTHQKFENAKNINFCYQYLIFLKLCYTSVKWCNMFCITTGESRLNLKGKVLFMLVYGINKHVVKKISTKENSVDV